MNFSSVEIVTERLVLKPVSLQYKKEIFSELTEEVTTYLLVSPPSDISETELFINQSIRDRETGKNLALLVLNNVSGEFLGCTGFHDIDSTSPRVGLWLKKSAWGQKYGLEAIAGLKKWASENLPCREILYPVDRANIASRKIAEALGGEIIREYDKEGMNGKILNVIQYRITT